MLCTFQITLRLPTLTPVDWQLWQVLAWCNMLDENLIFSQGKYINRKLFQEFLKHFYI